MRKDTAKRFKRFTQDVCSKYSEISDKMPNFSEQQIKDMANGNKKITPEIAVEFEEKYFLNATWLIFGRGDMYIPKFDLGIENNTKDMTNEEILETLEKREQNIESIRKEIQELKNKITK